MSAAERRSSGGTGQQCRNPAPDASGSLPLLQVAFLVEPFFSKLNAVGRVHVEQLHGCSPGRCASDDLTAMQSEMISPRILPWIEQLNDLTSLRIVAGEVRAFVSIASITGQYEPGWIICLANMLLGDDVIDVEREERRGFLRDQAILTTIASSTPNKFTRGLIHATPGAWPESVELSPE